MAGKASSRRPEQVAETIRAVLAEALLRGDLRDPRIGLVTVSAVDVTRDLSHATVIVVPHGDDEAKQAAIEGLRSAAGYLRRMVSKELSTRIVPELHFQLDRGFEHARDRRTARRPPPDEEPPERWTSQTSRSVDVHDVVQWFDGGWAFARGTRWTLDPFATGCSLCWSARRRDGRVEGLPKRYDAVVRLGTATDTDDLTGAVVATATPPDWPGEGTVRDALRGFTGESDQRPPAYSAKHVGGTRSHALARRGVHLELAPVQVTVHAIALTSYHPPDIGLSATVGRGTYLRAIARDLGERLGTVAHCAALRRLSTGGFDVADAGSPEEAGPELLIPRPAS